MHAGVRWPALELEQCLLHFLQTAFLVLGCRAAVLVGGGAGHFGLNEESLALRAEAVGQAIGQIVVARRLNALRREDLLDGEPRGRAIRSVLGLERALEGQSDLLAR